MHDSGPNFRFHDSAICFVFNERPAHRQRLGPICNSIREQRTETGRSSFFRLSTRSPHTSATRLKAKITGDLSAEPVSEGKRRAGLLVLYYANPS
jgi:hypothetical protein